MSFSHWHGKSFVLAILIGATLVATYPIRAQDQPPKPEANSQVVPVLIRSHLFAEGHGDDKDKQALLAATENALANLSDELYIAWLDGLDKSDELLGATLQPVGDLLRAQLPIPAGQGLLVASLRANGPSAQAGLKQNDVLLSLADKPLATTEDLTKHLKAAGEAAVPLKLLRGGKQVTIQVRPNYRVTLGPAAEPKSEYFIGVSLEPVDDALRAQLELPADRGVVVSDVIAGSPAEKAGIKKFDVVLELGGKLVATPEALAKQVQTNRDAPTTVTVQRAGQLIRIPVTAAVRKVEAPGSQDALRYWARAALVQPRYVEAKNMLSGALTQAVVEQDVKQRLDHLEQELKALRAAIDKINETLKGMKRD
jgi:serine protease Do